MPSLFSRIRGKDGKFRSKKNGNDDAVNQLATKPRWDDAYARTSVEPEEIQDLIHRCTAELKGRALDLPFLLLPFRPTSDPSAVRTFIRHFFDDEKHNLHGEALTQELRMTEPMVITGVLKWCWSRVPGGLVGWDAYELFKVGEQDSNMAPDSFTTFIPLSVDNEARSTIVFDYFDLLSAVAAHGKANGLGGRKLSRMASWWAFEHKDTSDGFEGGYKIWSRAADATSHLFFAYLRSLSPQQPRTAGISLLPMSLQKLLQETEYPPQTPTLSFSPTYRVVMIVDTVSPTPFALLRRANHFQYRESDKVLREFSEHEDPVRALTEECHRVLKAISLANQSQVSSSKHSTGLRDASWSRFEDIGFSGSLEEEEDDDETVKISFSRRPGLRTTPASAGHMGRPTTPSWADFLSSGFIDDSGPSNTLLPPDKVLPPIETDRQRTSRSHHGRLESDRPLEPGELASITQFNFDEAFWWVWMSSLAPEETAERKSAFGRCAVVETAIQSGKWLVMEEMVKGAAPELDASAYIAEKKGFFSWTRRGRPGLTRSRSNGRGIFNKQANPSGTATTLVSKTSIAPDQQAKIQAAAQQLSARQQQQRQQADIPERRGRSDMDTSGDKTHSVLTLQPVIVKEASPAMKWANRYDKEAIREAYLGDMSAGRGLGQLGGMPEINGNVHGPEVPDKYHQPFGQEPASEQVPHVPGKSLKDIHPAERPVPIGRDSPLPPLPRGEDSAEITRQTMNSPLPSATSPDDQKQRKLHKEDKKTTRGLRKLFGRNKNRNSKGFEPSEVGNLALEPVKTAESSRAQSPLPPQTPRPPPPVYEPAQVTSTAEAEHDMTPNQESAPAAADDVTDNATAAAELSRVNTADADEARDEFSRFDQGPLLDQPAFVPKDVNGDESGDVAPPPIPRDTNGDEEEHERDEAPAPIVATQDRWAAIRRNAAERAARQSEEQSRGGYNKTTDGDDETSGEETIESRVARIKARVAELTGNMEGANSPGMPLPATRR